MRAATDIGPYRTLAPLGPDRWSVDGPVEGAIAQRLDGLPGPGFEGLAARLARLRHAHLWPLLAAARVDGRGWIVTPEPSGGTLADRLDAGHHPPYKVALGVGVAVLRGLAAAHDAGFSHPALDPGHIAWAAGRVQIMGIGHGALVGRPGTPADDLRAVARLLGALVPDPPGELRALLAAPMPTAEAFCRALKTLDPALDQADELELSEPPPAPPPRRATPPPASSTATPPPAEDTWGVDPPAADAPARDQGKGWVVASRAMVESSTEDTWGVGAAPEPAPSRSKGERSLERDHTGAVVHTVTTARAAQDAAARRSPLATAAVAIAVIAVALVGARILMNQLADRESVPAPTIAPGAVPLADAAPPAPDAAPADAATDGAPDGADAADDRPRVTLLIGPVPARVVRVEDGAVICDEARRCPVPIDVDYRVEAQGHIPQAIDGDDLYDRRSIGRLELRLQPVVREPRGRRKRR